MPRPVDSNSRYMAGMDGLRAIAVLAVIAYHLNVGWASGGLLGVGVFFVLSGYLITNMLVEEHERYGHIRFKNFWFRRARRLLPALFLMLAVVIGWVTLFDPGEVVTLRGDALAAVLYFSNWWYIFHHLSYFAKFGPQSPLTHLWSLAVEEQFYLVWPLALALGLGFIRKKSLLVSLTIAAACASALAMALIYQPGTDPSRVYYGTDTRAFGLLFGAALALVRPARRIPQHTRRGTPLWAELLGAAGLLGIFLMIWQTNEYQTFLYRGGLVLLSLATAAALVPVIHPDSRMGKILGWGPLRWLGVRSYSIYLWHYPVIVLTTPRVDTGSFDPVRALLQVAASIALASLSWHFIEEPIRQGAIGRLVERWKAGRGVIGWSTWIGGVAMVSVLGLAIGGLSGLVEAVPVSAAQASGIGINHPIGRGPSSETPSKSASTPPSSTAPSSGSPSTPTTTSSAVPSTPPASTATSPANRPSGGSAASHALSGVGVTAIGDSVMVDATPDLRHMLPGIQALGLVGRQLIYTPPLISKLKSEHRMGNIVIIELGTNGPYTSGQLVSLLRSMGPVKHIFLVNTRVPRPWQNVVNATIAHVAATFPHTTLVNWYQVSANENGWFYPDGVHLNPTGAQAYANMLVKAIRPYLPAN